MIDRSMRARARAARVASSLSLRRLVLVKEKPLGPPLGHAHVNLRSIDDARDGSANVVATSLFLLAAAPAVFGAVVVAALSLFAAFAAFAVSALTFSFAFAPGITLALAIACWWTLVLADRSRCTTVGATYTTGAHRPSLARAYPRQTSFVGFRYLPHRYKQPPTHQPEASQSFLAEQI